MRPRLLDLFCGGGGAAEGYRRAGFDVTGIDNREQPRYPFRFIEADALEYARAHGAEYDVIHASPPCQGYSITRGMHTQKGKTFPDLVPAVRETLRALAVPWIIENVYGAPLEYPVMLCGVQFGLTLFRHRFFESSVSLFVPAHAPHREQVGRNGFVTMAGHGDRYGKRIPYSHRSVASWRAASGIDWLIRDELVQAIPPAYTEFLGNQLRAALGRRK